METLTKHFSVVDEGLVETIPFLLKQAGVLDEDVLMKSSAHTTAQYKVTIGTFSSLNTYMTYSFNLNELESEFDKRDNKILSVVLRDTSVNKKISFTKDQAVLTYARGQDTVGKNSEVQAITTREPVHTIKINSHSFKAPFDLEDVYEKVTGVNLNELHAEDWEEEERNANMWEQFIEGLENPEKEY